MPSPAPFRSTSAKSRANSESYKTTPNRHKKPIGATIPHGQSLRNHNAYGLVRCRAGLRKRISIPSPHFRGMASLYVGPEVWQAKKQKKPSSENYQKNNDTFPHWLL